VQFPVSIELHRSRILSLLIVLIHAIAAGCAGVLSWPWQVRLLLLVLVGASLKHAIRPPKILGLRLYRRDRLECWLVDGHFIPLAVLPDSTVFSRLIVLRLRMGEAKQICHLALLPDQMTAEQFRVLRFWLRWRTEPKKDVGSAF
jgi:toxin CptA